MRCTLLAVLTDLFGTGGFAHGDTPGDSRAPRRASAFDERARFVGDHRQCPVVRPPMCSVVRKASFLAVCVTVLLGGAVRPCDSAGAQKVRLPSGSLTLQAYLWVPAGAGPFPAVLFNHGRSDSGVYHWRERNLTLSAAAQEIGPIFARHGYVLLFPFRRGEGPSRDQGAFIGELLQQEEAERGKAARAHLQLVLLTTDHLDDAMAGLRFLKAMPQVDVRRIAVVGHSFGGGITLLQGERDPTIRAMVTFGAAAASWEGSEELRNRLLKAIDGSDAPVLLIHAANDYSLAPGEALAAERRRLSKPYRLQIYPAVGRSASDGHNFIYTDVALWERDVFVFLAEELGRP